jgi:hypothetical protein
MKTVTNRGHAKSLTVKVGGKPHSYKKYSWGLHHPTFGPLKDEKFNSKAEMQDAMEKHPAYNPQLKEEASVKDKASGLNKAYVGGLSASTAKARKRHWEKMSKYSDRDPRAYEPAPGDARAKTKPSKATKEVRKIMNMTEEADKSLAAKAKKFGVPVSTLKTVYKRGVAAWNSGHRPGTTPQQWGHARVNAYLRKSKGTYHGADKDLREDVPVNNAGGGNVAGIGVGPQGEPPGKIAAMKKKPIKRFKDFVSVPKVDR